MGGSILSKYKLVDNNCVMSLLHCIRSLLKEDWDNVCAAGK